MHLCLCQAKPPKLFIERRLKGVLWHEVHLALTGVMRHCNDVADVRGVSWECVRREGPCFGVFLIHISWVEHKRVCNYGIPLM